jgi:outer membrane lipopolysaccharide assembly protein LptE/RlpB
MQKLLTLILSITTLVGCGFHLQNSNKIAESYPQIILYGNDNDLLYKELLKELTLEDVEVIVTEAKISESLKGDIPILSCSRMAGASKDASVGSNSQVLEYLYQNTISCSFFVKGKKPYVIKASLNRVYLNKSGAKIATDAEKRTINEESAKTLTKNIIYRLRNSYLSFENEKKAKEKTKVEKIKIVIDALNKEESETYEISNEEEIKALEMNFNKDNKSNLRFSPSTTIEENDLIIDEDLQTIDDFQKAKEEGRMMSDK